MTAKPQNQKIILGLKVRQLRLRKKITFKELKEKTGMSISYLNEIEKGKKYPKADKIQLLAEALGEKTQTLTSQKLEGNLIPVGELLQSNFLNELPLDIFGIDLMKVVEIIATAPTKVGAFIATLVELSRSHEVGEASFYQAAVRAYQELHFNYFEDIEKAAFEFRKKYKFPEGEPVTLALLEQTLTQKFNYTIVEKGLTQYPALKNLRSVYIPQSRKLILNQNISETERAFQYSKELAFHYLQLEERAYTSSLISVKSFDLVLNHFKAVYFAAALLVHKDAMIQDLKSFFGKSKWNGDAFLDLRSKYKVSPEIMLARLTNLLPTALGLKKFFFMRVIYNPQKGGFLIDKELHLNQSHHPHSNRSSEHYCRRWMSISLLQDLAQMQSTGRYLGTIVGAQRIRFYGTEEEYFSLTFARPGYGVGKLNSSVSIGLLLDEHTRKTIKFVEDPSIAHKVVNVTCERCPIVDCQQRAAPAYIIQKKEARREMQKELERLYKNA